MSGRIVFLNGQYVPESEARISIFDSALVLGDMAFESTRTFRGEPFQLRAHLERLFGTLHILEIDCGWDIDALEVITRETLAQNRATEDPSVEWQIVHNISPGPVDLYRAAFSDRISPTVCINCWPIIPQIVRIAPLYETGVRLVIPEQRALPPSLINPHAKTRSRVHAKLAQLQASRIEPHAWPMLLDVEGYLAEGPSWNIFLVREGRLLTPSTRNILPGISRSITRKMADELNIPIEEADIPPDAARAAEEMFCTATSFCIVPVKAFDGTPIGNGCPGPVTKRLMEGWRAHVGVDFVSQAQQYVAGYAAWLEKERQAQQAKT